MLSKEKFDPTIPNAQCATTKWLKASHFSLKTFCVIVPDLHQPMDCYTEWRCIKKMKITSSQGTGRAKTHLIERKCCCSEERQRQNTVLKERLVSVEGEVKCLWNLLCELVQGHFHWVFLKGIKCASNMSEVPKIKILIASNWCLCLRVENRTSVLHVFIMGSGWGGVGWVENVHLHFVIYMMLRYCASHIWCYVTVWGGVGWGGVITFSCTSSHIWCYVIVPHIYDATLLCLTHMMLRCCNIVLHFRTYMMLRYCASHIWCYVTVPHTYDATLL